MATEIYLTRHPNFTYLVPAYEGDQEVIKKMKHGEVYKGKLSLPRNIKFHKKFFALLGIVFENLPHDFAIKTEAGQEIEIKDTDSLLWHIKMQMGYHEEKVTLGGRITYEAKSISFASMDEIEFQEFYSKAIDVILKYFLKGANKEELEQVVILEFG
jgi:hypothetical protein